ncbi:PSB1 [Hepatospora eriocheir]|uniref:proteasome endopeptidase complex n=1 Tax=Hepatospora eriocheir TaxID=1081669 RepID=A0A1X0QFQ6_9MICR|nr:PSB1 [Hepatospora eriocheir]
MQIDCGEYESNGTSILGLRYKNGVLFAADSRTTTGQFVSTRDSDKIVQCTDNIVSLGTGRSAHIQKLNRLLSKEISELAVSEETQPSITKSVKMIKNILYNNRDLLSCEFIIGGYDNDYKLFKVCKEGVIVEDDLLIAGSGSTFIRGYTKSVFKKDMSKEEAMKFAIDSLRLAINCDNSSGGLIRICIFEGSGVERFVLDGQDVFFKNE